MGWDHYDFRCNLFGNTDPALLDSDLSRCRALLEPVHPGSRGEAEPLLVDVRAALEACTAASTESPARRSAPVVLLAFPFTNQQRAAFRIEIGAVEPTSSTRQMPVSSDRY